MTALGVTASLKIRCCREPVPRQSPADESRRYIPARPPVSPPKLASDCASSASTSGRRGAPVLPPNRVHLSPAEAMQTVHAYRTAGFQRPYLGLTRAV